MDRKRFKRFLDLLKKVLVALSFGTHLLLAILQLINSCKWKAQCLSCTALCLPRPQSEVGFYTPNDNIFQLICQIKMKK